MKGHKFGMNGLPKLGTSKGSRGKMKTLKDVRNAKSRGINPNWYK